MPEIKRLFAFIAEEAPGDEGVMGMKMPDGAWYPFIGADMRRVKSLIPLADKIAQATGIPYKIVKFKIDPED